MWVLVLHDFDKAGFDTVHTLCHDMRRYKFRCKPRVIDISLRLADVRAMNLGSEHVNYVNCEDPRRNLEACGAAAEEISFLVSGRNGKTWFGERLELNGMKSAEFIRLLESKLTEVGAEKLVPEAATLRAAYQGAVILGKLQDAVDRILEGQNGNRGRVPWRLGDSVRDRLMSNPALSWNEAVWDLALKRRDET